MANKGYGKRHAGDQVPPPESNFAHLSRRAASIAVFICALVEGAAMGVKTLAAHHPDHGQQGCASALRELTYAGHLRRVKEHLALDAGGMRWVTRTYWSPTARSDEWWAEFVRGVKGIDVTAAERDGLAHVSEEPPEQAEAQARGAAPEPAEPARSVAYNTLAQLGDADREMSLSAAECAALEPLAAEWLARGASPERLIRTLTAGLPRPVLSAGALARNRLETKMPPTKTPKDTGRARVTRVVMACMGCDEDERTEPIIDGLCGPCFREFEAELVDGEGRHVPDTFRAVPRQRPMSPADQARVAAGLPPKGAEE
ncbi:hypothetical protein [Streptomyces sp. NPDC050485]|uniref:hypothetical protein n=1 Tax=Streptomyces sp. NPDC050485 TaxID=3365617 RepID=UPI0037A75D59